MWNSEALQTPHIHFLKRGPSAFLVTDPGLGRQLHRAGFFQPEDARYFAG